MWLDRPNHRTQNLLLRLPLKNGLGAGASCGACSVRSTDAAAQMSGSEQALHEWRQAIWHTAARINGPYPSHPQPHGGRNRVEKACGNCYPWMAPQVIHMGQNKCRAASESVYCIHRGEKLHTALWYEAR